MKINGNPDGGGGQSAVIESLSVTSNGTYTAGAGVDGYSPVEVSVPEQKPEETFNVTPSTTEQTITPQEGYVFTSGVVGAVTSNIDANIQAGNIKSGVTILGVEGNYTAPAPVTESLSVSVNGTYTPGQGVDGFSQVTVNVPQSVTGFTEKDVTEGIQVVNLSNSASYVHPYVFEYDSYLQTVNLPNCIVVYENAFYGCENLTSVYLENCTNINKQAFYACSKLNYVSVPELKTTGITAFQDCKSLVSIDLPKLSVLSDQTFYRCSSLQYVSLPVCTNIGRQAFVSCRALTSIDLPKCENFGSGMFSGCIALSVIYIGKDLSTVPTLAWTNLFTGTPIASGTGSIYVPSSLVDAYKSANNWSLYSSQIFAIPE